MVRIIVAGGSFGGLTAALELKRMFGPKAAVTVMSDDDKFVFAPSLPWLSLGWRRATDITLPLRPLLQRRGIAFLHQAVMGVDAAASKIITAKGELSYDYLVVATGPALAFDEVPGLGPAKGYSECIFTLAQAERAKSAWDRFREDPGAIVVGSVQGVSCFGPPYEYAFELDAELRRRGMRHKTPLFFVTSEPYIGHFGIGGLRNSRRIMEDEFAKRDIRFIANTAVEEIAPGEARLKDGTKLPFKLAMLAPAMKGVAAVSPLGNPRGFIPVDGNYRHAGIRNVFAVGVAVAIAPLEQTPVPTGVPKTGSMTVRMAKKAAAVIAAEIGHRALPVPEDLSVTCLMDMGDTAAYMRARPVLPPRQESKFGSSVVYRWAKIGFERYFLWKTAWGLSNLP